MKIFSRWIAAAVIAFSILPITTRAEEWPSRPITLVVGFTAGSPTDLVARIIAEDLSKILGQPVIVENKPGGAGVLALTSVATAPADGYTLLMTAIGPAVIRPLLESKLPYNMQKEFAPIALVGETPNVIIATPNGRFAGIGDMLAYAKANPGKLTIGHLGVGTMGHLTAVLFVAEAGIKANLVAYKGSPQVISDVAGGHIDAGSLAYVPSMTTVKIIAAASEQPVDFLPNVPTTGDSNLPNVVSSTWFAIFAPTALPRSVLTKLNTSVNSILTSDSLKERFGRIGFKPLGGSPERLKKQMADDSAKWSKVIDKAPLNQN